MSILVAIGVNQDGYCEVLGVMEGAKEDKASWLNFMRHLKERGLTGVRLFISDKCTENVIKNSQRDSDLQPLTRNQKT